MINALQKRQPHPFRLLSFDNDEKRPDKIISISTENGYLKEHNVHCVFRVYLVCE